MGNRNLECILIKKDGTASPQFSGHKLGWKLISKPDFETDGFKKLCAEVNKKLKKHV